MNVAVPTYTSYEDYLVKEETSDVKHEWCHGAVYAITGGLLGKCTGYSSEAMLFIEAQRCPRTPMLPSSVARSRRRWS